MSKPSFLAQAVLEPMLNTARKNLERDGYLVPVLFVQASIAGLQIGSLMLPQTPEQKRRYLAGLGSAFRQRDQMIRSAAMLSESWFVNAQETPGTMTIPPSKHPDRQEAISLIGRDANKTRITHVIKPITRDAQNRPLCGDPVIAFYNEPAQTTGKFNSLLDYLFLANKGVK